jgi:hypothetical protein
MVCFKDFNGRKTIGKIVKAILVDVRIVRGLEAKIAPCRNTAMEEF